METYQNIHQTILDKCKKGDSKAQFELYKRYYKAMYHTSLRIVSDTHEAEDCMQEAFLSAFARLDSYKGEVSFGAWLKRIVVNKSLDALKKKHKLFETNEYTGAYIPQEDEDTGTEEIDWQVERIKKAMEQLHEGYRVVFSLFLFEGYDHDEIASILNISVSTSRSQLSRAKKKIVEILRGL